MAAMHADTAGPTPPSTPPFSNGASAEKLQPYENGHLEAMEASDAFFVPESASHLAKMRRKRKDESLVEILRSWIVQHQIGISIDLLLLLFLTHICFPRARPRTKPFFSLSYYDSRSKTYNPGPLDLLYVTYWIVVFTGLRAAVMNYVLLPWAKRAGISKAKAKVRFAEQAWLLIYYSFFWTLGMYIMYNSSYWLNFRAMWADYPTRAMSGFHKWYYLVQFAFWLQQIVVVNIEEKRNDHWQMFTHHLVTSALIFTSYGNYQTKVGNVILCVMDVVDLALPAAKMLKYCGYQTACDIAFGIFIVVWFVARHVIYLMICWSVHFDMPGIMKDGCYSSLTGKQLTSDGGTDVLNNVLQAYLNPGGVICSNWRIRNSFLALLLFLQGITLLWFVMIIRVAWNVVKGNGADDSRSDDGEGEDEEEDVEVELAPVVEIQPTRPVEHLVGVEELHLKRRTSPRYRASGSRGGGISIPGHSDRKEILGRIGCDKPT